MTSKRLFRRYYPDDSLSGTLRFYAWLRRYLRPEMALLNLGAGPATENPIRSFRGEVKFVAGADVDPVVLNNQELDDARVIADGVVPYPDRSFDIVVSDFVLEHVEHPLPFLREVRRLLRPGGSFFFRTPNRLHYVSLIARMTPHAVHLKIANWARGLGERAREPYRTFFRMNSRRAIERAARAAGFAKTELRFIEAEPSYLVFNPLAFLAGVAYERMVNRFGSLRALRANIIGRLEA